MRGLSPRLLKMKATHGKSKSYRAREGKARHLKPVTRYPASELETRIFGENYE